MSELKNKTEIDLVKTLNEKREALKNFRFGIAGSKTRNVREGRSLKKEIAKLNTEMRARQIK